MCIFESSLDSFFLSLSQTIASCTRLGSAESRGWLRMEGWTTSQVAELLKKEGFRDDVVQLFVVNEIDGEALMMLETDEHMKEVGLTKHGDQLKIKKFIKKCKEGANAKEIPPDDHERESVRKCIQFTCPQCIFENLMVCGLCIFL